MIYAISIPHQLPAAAWVADNEKDFISKVIAAERGDAVSEWEHELCTEEAWADFNEGITDDVVGRRDLTFEAAVDISRSDLLNELVMRSIDEVREVAKTYRGHQEEKVREAARKLIDDWAELEEYVK